MQFSTRVYKIIDSITANRYWLLLAALLLTTTALFFSFPSYGDINPKEWAPLFEKAANPFANGSYADGTHAAKLSFRLVLPLIIHYLHLNITGVLILLGIIGVLNFYLVVKLAHTILQDKQQAFITGLCSALIYFGKCSFTDLRGTMFDGLAICFLLSAMLSRHYLATAIFIFLSAWCDERGLIASALIWLYFVIKNDEPAFFKKIFSKQLSAIYLAWIAYITIRYVLSTTYGLHTDTKGVGLSVLLNQINNIPMGIWSALEGLWLLVIMGGALLYRNKRYIELLKYIGICGIILILGLSVVDITRSVVYIFPIVFIALYLINKYCEKEMLHKLLWYALILCFVYPAYYTGGKSSIWWTYPLPLQMLR